MMEPFVSIIIPVYNAEKTLEYCVESVRCQMFADFEVILVDDGSSDNTSTICDKLSLGDIRVKVVHQVNSGVSHARNRGIEEATGKWLYFMDSDDWIEPCYLDNFVRHIADNDIVIQGYQYDGERQGIVRYKEFVSESSEEVIGHLFEVKASLVGVNWDKLYKKDIITRCHLRFNSEIHFAEDTIFFLEYLGYVKRIGVQSTIGYHYVISNAGLTGKRYPSEYYLKILDIFVEKLDALNVSTDFRNKYVWNAMEYWLLYPNMKYGYQEFDFDDMYCQLTSFIRKHQLWGAPKISFTSVCLGWALRCNNPKTKYKIIRFIHWYVRRSENRIRSFFDRDYKKI